VGWYLMVPSMKTRITSSQFVPLPKGVVLRGFDTAIACDEAQD
jgi:hypothetical protein